MVGAGPRANPALRGRVTDLLVWTSNRPGASVRPCWVKGTHPLDLRDGGQPVMDTQQGPSNALPRGALCQCHQRLAHKTVLDGRDQWSDHRLATDAS